MLKNISLGNNEGTYGPTEARNAIGTSNPEFANSEIYIDGNGVVQYRGCDPRKAPGRFRFSDSQFKLTIVQKESLARMLGN